VDTSTSVLLKDAGNDILELLVKFVESSKTLIYNLVGPDRNLVLCKLSCDFRLRILYAEHVVDSLLVRDQ